MEFPQYLALSLFKSVWWFKKYSLILYELSNAPLKPSTLVAPQHQLIVNSILQFAIVLHVLYQEKKVYTIICNIVLLKHLFLYNHMVFAIRLQILTCTTNDLNVVSRWVTQELYICIRSFPYGSVQVSMLLLKYYWHDYDRKIESSLSIFLFMLLKYKL